MIRAFAPLAAPDADRPIKTKGLPNETVLYIFVGRDAGGNDYPGFSRGLLLRQTRRRRATRRRREVELAALAVWQPERGRQRPEQSACAATTVRRVMECEEAHRELGGMAARGFGHRRYRAQSVLRRSRDLDSVPEGLHPLRVRSRPPVPVEGSQRYPRK